jgi:aspartyl-tRNA(Asn)/glutamyl-tRNA(Gln) amidotransferase subunit A
MSIGHLLRRQASGRLSALSITTAALDRIAAEDGRWRGMITVDVAGARTAAAAIDQARAAGQPQGPLAGVPVVVKDNIAVAGLPLTDGTGRWRDRIAARDAGCVARLRAAGAVILGKANLHEGALGATTDNPHWGRAENPAAPGHSPGGSSGGSAVALAAGYAPLALGTDTMGSVRIPAAYCGLWALKPTRGLIGNSGLSHLSWTLDTIGPMATGAKDLMAALAVLAGPDPADPFSDARPLVPLRRDGLKGLILGLPAEADGVTLEPPLALAFAALCDRLRTAGVRLVPVSLAGWDPARLRRAGLLVAEAEAGSLIGAELDADEQAGGAGFSPAFRAAVNFGRRAPGARLAEAWRRLALAGVAARWALSEVAAILMPTTPHQALPLGVAVPDSQADLTALANAAGLPAVAFPLPVTPGTRPVGAQLVGAPYADARLIALAGQMARLP